MPLSNIREILRHLMIWQLLATRAIQSHRQIGRVTQSLIVVVDIIRIFNFNHFSVLIAGNTMVRNQGVLLLI